MDSQSTVKILVVDDDEVDIRVLTRGLRINEIDNPVVVARDGLHALEILRGKEGEPPLRWPYIVLLDLNMPRMNGLEFLEVLRQDEALYDTPVFVMTTSEDDRDMIESYKRNVAGYLVKTRCADRFVEVLDMIGRYVSTVRFHKKPERST